jgi:putative transposase
MRRKSLGYSQQAAELSEIKEAFPAYQDIYSQVLQDVLRRLDKAFSAFFRRLKNGEKPGYPRFQGQGRYDSFTYPQSGFALAGLSESGSNRYAYLTLSKIGDIKVRLHRPMMGQVKTCTSHSGCESLVRDILLRSGRGIPTTRLRGSRH